MRYAEDKGQSLTTEVEIILKEKIEEEEYIDSGNKNDK